MSEGLEEPSATRAVRAPAIGAVHATSTGSLLTRTAHDGALELLQGAADLVAKGGVALLVNHGATTAEEAVTAGGSCCGCVTMRHCYMWLWLVGFGLSNW